MNYILSKYSYFFNRNNKFYIFNSESCAFAEVDESIFCLIKSNNIDQISDNERMFFIQKKIIIPEEEYDEFIHNNKIKYLTNSYDSSELSLVLIPTTGCNFACSYCFEEKKKNTVMSNEVINELIKFIQEHVNARKLSITWYGGEPLMSFPTIKKIFSSIKKNINIPIISQSLITNGYFLDEHKIKYFKKIDLNSVQITLDGKKETHNNTRNLKGTKKGSYDIIIKNIDRLVSVFPECKVSIRINISNKNKEEFIALYEEFSARWKSDKVYIYPGFIREDATDGCSFSTSTLNAEERFDFYKQFHEKGYTFSPPPERVNKGCMINRLNSYIIGPQGEIYKCWNDVTNQDKIIGYINQKKIKNKKLFYSCMEDLSPFKDSRCVECFLFPICSGGCAWYRYRNNFESGRFNLCPYYKDKHKLEELLILSLEKNNNPINNIGLKKINCW